MKNSLLNIEIPKNVAWVLWLSWTGLLCFLFLSPSDGTVKSVSSFFGGTDITDAIGHVILVGVDCVLLYVVARHYQPEIISLRIAVGMTLIIGLLFEVAQLFIPSRGASLIDFVAAFVGVGIAFLLINYRRVHEEVR